MARSKRIEFCCCAIPLINVGAYTICVQFAIIAFCTLLLAVVPPSIVAATGSLPASWPKIVVLVLSLTVLLWQIAGLVAIRRERTGLYRTYIRINFLLTLLTIVVLAAFFAVAAARHSTALTSCTAAYGSSPDGNTVSQLSSVGGTICNIWIWVQVGAMGLLLLVIGLMQLYMCALQRAYGKEMRRAAQDHKAYAGPGDEIPLATRDSAVWQESPTSPTAVTAARNVRNNNGAVSPDNEYIAEEHYSRDNGADYYYGRRQSLQQQHPNQAYESYHGYPAPTHGYHSQQAY